jgi:hypothetical protein
MSDDVIYENTVDQGEWEVLIARTGPYTGRFTITRAADGREIYDRTVHLAYGARFGPDVDDVAQWQERAIRVIDNYKETNPV